MSEQVKSLLHRIKMRVEMMEHDVTVCREAANAGESDTQNAKDARTMGIDNAEKVLYLWKELQHELEIL